MHTQYNYFSIFCLILNSVSLSLQTGNLTNSHWQKLPNAILDIVTTNLNVMTGLPLNLAATVVDTVCSSTLFMGGVPKRSTPDITKMRLQYMRPCLNYSVPILEAEKLWSHSKFRGNRKLVILATGWMNTVNDSDTIHMISKAFMCRPNINFVIVDAADYVGKYYKWSALNTDMIGEHLAVGLQHLIKATPHTDIHLVGHSLGAHIMGTAGRSFRRLTGQLVSRITGLDPAKPCFRYEQVLSGLMRGDAQVVDVIHTNVGILAKRKPMGDIDFYPGGVSPIMPGCLTVACSHRRAVEYFAESIYPQYESSFLGMKCESWTELSWRKCKADKTTTMGYIIDDKASGIYYVEVNRGSPFGRNSGKLPSLDWRREYAKCVTPKCPDFIKRKINQ